MCSFSKLKIRWVGAKTGKHDEETVRRRSDLATIRSVASGIEISDPLREEDLIQSSNARVHLLVRFPFR